MSSVNKPEPKKLYVITYKELVFTVMIFVIILVALYPKDLLKQQIVAEKANYDLSMLYLKNLLKHNPEDESLMLILATQSLKTGNKDLAIRLLELLFQSKNKKIRQKAIMLSYDLEKERYFYMHDKKRKAKQLKKLKKLFIKIYTDKMYDEKDLKKWYMEATFVGASYPAYQLLQKLLKKEPNTLSLIRDAYYLAAMFHHKEQAYTYLHYLQKHDTQHTQKWLLEEYFLDMKYKDYEAAQKLLLAHQNDNVKMKRLLGDFYLYRQEYKKASDVYLSLYAQSDDYKERKRYFKRALQALVASKESEKITQLLQANESQFLKDGEMRKFMLQTYLANGRLEDAAKLSKKILGLKYKK